MSALDTQVAGEHYKKYKIQPMEYSMANGLDACQHTAIKYITRFRDKGGIEDLEKAKHCIDMLIEFERKGWATSPEDWIVGTRLKALGPTTQFFTEGREYRIQSMQPGGWFSLIDDEGTGHRWTIAEAAKCFVST